jgi:hypothetical protein
MVNDVIQDEITQKFFPMIIPIFFNQDPNPYCYGVSAGAETIRLGKGFFEFNVGYHVIQDDDEN